MNLARSTKWYSRPFCSPGRGFLVVCETLKARSETCAKSLLVKVVLPAPEGDDTISGRGPLLDILHLFTHAFDFCLHFDDHVGEIGILALGADRVDLTSNFLQ